MLVQVPKPGRSILGEERFWIYLSLLEMLTCQELIVNSF